MKYDIILRFVAAIMFFTFMSLAQQHHWAVTLFGAAGIYCAVTGMSKILKPGQRK